MRWKTEWLVATLASVALASAASSFTSPPTKIGDQSNADSIGHQVSPNRPELIQDNTIEETDEKHHSRQVEIVNSNELDNTKEKYAESDVEVEDYDIMTTFGPLLGHSCLTEESNTIQCYIDIPYGQFKLFEEPSNPPRWDKTRHEKKHTVKCPQMKDNDYIGDPNCLTLSVFVPEDAENAGVLFYIHESNLKSGSADHEIYRPDNLVNKGLILVLPNYRLGPLGFLCLQNSTAPGNAALKDLTLALNWTKENIKEFGGDPMNIVVGGDGTSAALAEYLAISSKSRHYISKVISDTGSALSHWAIDRDPVDTATKLANHIITMFKNKNYNNNLFSDIDIELLTSAANDTYMKPCIETKDDHAFMDKSPWYIVTHDENINVTFIIGSANHAGLGEVKDDASALLELNEKFESLLPNDLRFEDEKTKKDIAMKIKGQYFGTNYINSSDLLNVSLYHSDVSYIGPSLRIAKALVDSGATVFLYEFSYVGKLNKELHMISQKLHFGATKGDIVGYLFPDNMEDIDPQKEPDKDLKIMNMITDMWVSFIQTGHPTAEGIEWKRINQSSEYWLSIDDEVKSMEGLHPERLELWSQVYKEHFVDNTAGERVAGNIYYVPLLLWINVVYYLRH